MLYGDESEIRTWYHINWVTRPLLDWSKAYTCLAFRTHAHNHSIVATNKRRIPLTEPTIITDKVKELPWLALTVVVGAEVLDVIGVTVEFAIGK